MQKLINVTRLMYDVAPISGLLRSEVLMRRLLAVLIRIGKGSDAYLLSYLMSLYIIGRKERVMNYVDSDLFDVDESFRDKALYIQLYLHLINESPDFERRANELLSSSSSTDLRDSVMVLMMLKESLEEALADSKVT